MSADNQKKRTACELKAQEHPLTDEQIEVRRETDFIQKQERGVINHSRRQWG